MTTKANQLAIILQQARHHIDKTELEKVKTMLEMNGYDLTNCAVLGEGSEAVALSVEYEDGEERVLKFVEPLLHGWHPDWGRRICDALIYKVEEEFVHQLSSGGFWFIQELAQPIERAEEIEEELWDDFMEQFDLLAQDLFLDDTNLTKQIGLVERDSGQQIVLIDYGSLSSQDMNLPLQESL